jgi:glycine cleavage system H protein
MNYKVDETVRYAKTHEWVRREGGEAVIGVSDYAQNKLSDVVFVDAPDVGRELKAGAACMVIESVKAAEEVFAPLGGTVIARNEKLVKSPELVNTDPFGEGWLVRVKVADEKELSSLMDAAAYRAFLATLQPSG